jgi:hypothetical protein
MTVLKMASARCSPWGRGRSVATGVMGGVLGLALGAVVVAANEAGGLPKAGEGFARPVELIQRTPDVSADGRCDLSVARTRIPSIRRAIRLNMPDGVR